jgi:hypothetical protein
MLGDSSSLSPRVVVPCAHRDADNARRSGAGAVHPSHREAPVTQADGVNADMRIDQCT